ncbi:unnamed protein product [Microthlaspi erraticum]|uniref:Uncharacterized protein n=1 Tax=Microthlaspi erraticum TaxID=1685480 RepID=A0A6D2K4G8_9BRAS|nr:unnamed protein product [Microthlaspi erraticum]
MEPRDYSDSESQKKGRWVRLGWKRLKKPTEGLADEALANVLNTILEKLNELRTKFELLQTNKTTVEEGSTKKRNEVGDEVAEEKVYDAEFDIVGENNDKKGCEVTPEQVSWYLF